MTIFENQKIIVEDLLLTLNQLYQNILISADFRFPEMISQINVFMAMSVLINSTTVDVLVQFMTKEEL
jgi:hypothetical protein